MEALIIRLTPYKEKDYIVNAVTSEGMITFRVVGALSLKSKFAGKLFLYALVDIELKESKGGFILANVENLTNMAKVFTEPNRMVALNFIGEIIQKTLKDDVTYTETFMLIKNTMIGLSKTNHILSLCYLFLTNLMRILGIGLVVNRCVMCGSQKDIVGVSFSLGGLVCLQCRTSETTLYKEEDIKLIRYGFMINEGQLFLNEFEDDKIKPLLQRFITHFEDTYNYKLFAKELLF